ncbi:dTDP-4-dehydrorhamnose 3,5-epimerase [Prosthecochloris sp. N3]|uniref:dTDP-4-dehydrorhamnose 3,5-epimerase n=1 Tax=Prosthecochloris ethylica TaxID=2743976 RepID=A0ABR9XUX4_9CHLB|nr:dTDP-4-dehydrorhamnose 3,5-epimerase [Prosthecochloris ethylica]MBF0587320.1 dTDP-4-dehydrorhamnose 3,5-epimerase [Prosthecochloris ethylica]MBF0637585.1 dTDP-4-dehydrorhamnose 3,5-epimerase [Prosthecochloris ethylica]NUK48293.1 dTDP-4-dehydrorhamnose 3,5-epimerase [Prosthecochloris ethylica]
MQIIDTAIRDVKVFEPRVFGDQRGYFLETFRRDLFERSVGVVDFVQDNESKSHYGVLRGLHYQKPPYTQGKLVRVVWGEVLDVAVDIRKGSPTFGRHVAVRLDADSKRMLWVPRGFAHGFVVLSEEAVFAYKCDNYYAPEADAGIRWNDPALGIDWLVDRTKIEVSEKDAKQPLFAEVEGVCLTSDE